MEPCRPSQASEIDSGGSCRSKRTLAIGWSQQTTARPSHLAESMPGTDSKTVSVGYPLQSYILSPILNKYIL
jgi:hypothetical protein